MRNPPLHRALHDFALEASAELSRAVDDGAELRFEVEAPGPESPLYRYRPLTAAFIAERWPVLQDLPTVEPAARALGLGAEAYLRVRGLSGEDAEPALRAMLERIWQDATDFAFPEERFDTVYAEVEETLYREAVRAEVVAPLQGVRMDDARLDLGDGLEIVSEAALQAPPDAGGRVGASAGRVYLLLERSVAIDASLPVVEARARFARLLTGLRLWNAGGVTFGPSGWGRADAGVWRALPLEGGGAARGEPLIIRSADAEELRLFLSEMSRSGRSGRVAWALGRFDMGCAREKGIEALTDYLLALRALLDGDTDVGRASLSLRVAALCAHESGRRALQRRVELALSLEQFVVAGGTGEAYLESVGSDAPEVLVLEIEDHLRALLRDVLCGYLGPDLRAAADEILIESAGPIEITARDLRVERRAPSDARVAPEGARSARELSRFRPGARASEASAEDDEAESYSAPV